MSFCLKHGEIVSKKQAEQMGFVIEGPIAFIFNLGNNIGILGYNTFNDEWQYDAAVNENGETWQFTKKSIHEALKEAEKISDFILSVYNGLGVNQTEFDHIGVLECWKV